MEERKIIVTFIKRTDLSKYFHDNFAACADQFGADVHSVGNMEYLREHYAKKRDVRLVVTERITDKGRIFVRINCPINPLPVKGEFEIPSWGVFKRFLESNGWKQREVITDNYLQ